MTVLVFALTVAVTVLLMLVLRLAVVLGRTVQRVDLIHRSLTTALEMLSDRFDHEDEEPQVMDVEEEFRLAKDTGTWAVCSFLDRQVREYIECGEPMPVEEWFYYMLPESALPYDQTVSMMEQMVVDMRAVIIQEQDAQATVIWKGE